MHSSITVGVRANIIPFKMIRTLNSTQQSPRTARDLLHFLSRPYPASFAFNLVLFRFILLNILLIPSISFAAIHFLVVSLPSLFYLPRQPNFNQHALLSRSPPASDKPNTYRLPRPLNFSEFLAQPPRSRGSMGSSPSTSATRWTTATQ